MGSLRGMGVPLLVYSYKIQMFFFANRNHGFLEDGLLSWDVSGGSDLTRYFRSHLYRPWMEGVPQLDP